MARLLSPFFSFLFVRSFLRPSTASRWAVMIEWRALLFSLLSRWRLSSGNSSSEDTQASGAILFFQAASLDYTCASSAGRGSDSGRPWDTRVSARTRGEKRNGRSTKTKTWEKKKTLNMPMVKKKKCDNESSSFLMSSRVVRVHATRSEQNSDNELGCYFQALIYLTQ